jgi:hypothetical protein
MVQFGRTGAQTGFDVAQTLAERQLSKGQAEKLVAAREAACPTIAPIATNAGVEFVTRQEVHQLGKHQLTGVHESSSILG